MASIIEKTKHALHMDKSTSHSHTTGTSTTHQGTSEGVAGAHNSRTANAADPRIDSDLDGSRNAGFAHNHGATTANHGLTGNNHSTGQTATGAPHSSKLANTLDPTVKSTGPTSQYDGSHVGNSSGNYNTGATGGISRSTNAGPHDSNALNKLDPRVDSDLDGRGNRHGATTGGITGASGSHATPGSGTAQNTAGPHNSDLLNKADPRVDADLDGSKTIGSATYR